MNLEEASFEQLDGDLIVKELCRELQIDANDLLNKLDELNLDSWDYLELVDAYEAEGYDIKDILDDYEFDENAHNRKACILPSEQGYCSGNYHLHPDMDVVWLYNDYYYFWCSWY